MQKIEEILPIITRSIATLAFILGVGAGAGPESPPEGQYGRSSKLVL